MIGMVIALVRWLLTFMVLLPVRFTNWLSDRFFRKCAPSIQAVATTS